jgi:hypothetical protein
MTYSTNQHAEWLSLIEISGPFLAEPILNQAFPQGLEKIDPVKKRQFRQTYDEWCEVIESGAQPDLIIKDKIHQQWTNWVLKFGLELDEEENGDTLKDQSQMHAAIQVVVPEHHVTLKPEYAVVASDETHPYMLIQTYPAGTALRDVLKGDGWSTSPAERMAHLCRGVGTRLGLITNGEQWMFIDAPTGGITTYASWFARLWGLEPITLKAFYSLFNIGIVFNGFDEAKSLPQLIDDSLQHQDDVTQTLGIQVSRAVEVLIQSIDRINHDHHGELLAGVEPEELYEAGLTFMMRLVFLLCAEERGLLLLGDQAYEANYALSTLRAKLREEASLHGEEVLSYRKNAWARLLAIFRSVYAGVEHENMRMPALGGSLFDPDRFPFLEGRVKGSKWLEDEAKPLPIDNRTVLLFLDAIQLYKGRTLSYRGLDVEQIGYVYEGLLEQTVKRAPDVTLELSGSKSCKKPWVYLGELASASLEGSGTLHKLLIERTGSSAFRITNDLAKEVTDADVDKLLVACYNDFELCQRIKPYYHFLRFDAWGNPLLYPKNAYMLTSGSDRRETGSHYTPKSLTESIVTETLEPIVYIGPAEGKPRDDWQLKSPELLLDLKICDPAMGSGAFLVQVCRWLAERVCESWLITEQSGMFITAQGSTTNDDSQELLPVNTEERLIVAKRLISERCLYGVDINPLAVELAKLSIWLITLSKGRPFGFLDHNLKSGDSLLGIHSLEQLCYLNLNPSGTNQSNLVEQPFSKQIKELVADTLEIRKKIASHDINLASDIEEMAKLEEQAREKILLPNLIADALIGLALESGGKLKDISVLSSFIQQAIAGDDESVTALKRLGIRGLNSDLPESSNKRKAFHWHIEFPEVFNFSNSGFDAIVGNPPFIGGKKISTNFGDKYRSYLVSDFSKGKKGTADFVVYFFLQSFRLISSESNLGLIASKTISEGETRRLGLDSILSYGGTIYSASPSLGWPGKATVFVSKVFITKKTWKGKKTIDSNVVEYISSNLSDEVEYSLKKIMTNKELAYQGSLVLGNGFSLSKDLALEMLKDPKNKDVLFPYLTADDINTSPTQEASRWIVCFWDWPEHLAQQFVKPYEHIFKHVYPERLEKSSQKSYFKIMGMWWIYWRARQELYEKIGRGNLFISKKTRKSTVVPSEEIIVVGRHTKYFNPVFVSNTNIYSEALIVFTNNNPGFYSFINSNVVQYWVMELGTYIGQTLRVTPTDCIETLPIPEQEVLDELSDLGKRLDKIKKNACVEYNIGLTKCYNLYHSPDCYFPLIVELRKVTIEIECRVFQYLGLGDVELKPDFYTISNLPKNDNIRYTILDVARKAGIRKLISYNSKLSQN